MHTSDKAVVRDDGINGKVHQTAVPAVRTFAERACFVLGIDVFLKFGFFHHRAHLRTSG